MAASATAFNSLAAEGLMVRLYSTTFSETAYKLFKANTFFFFPLLNISQIVCILGQCHAHRFINHIRY